MQGDPRFAAGRASPPHPYEVGGYDFDFAAGAHYAYGAPAPSDFDATLSGAKHHEFPGPLNGVEFQPSETCPKNFVIFDQTYSKSRVMFHPSLAHKFGRQNFGLNGTRAHEARLSLSRDNENYGEYSSSQKEDTEDIDALLSSEDGEEDDVVSTGRTPGSCGGSSPDSSDSSADKLRITRLKSSSDQKLARESASSSGRKRERMKKMVRTLRGIIPGGDQMESTPAVLDEAVKYLKSLKMEVKKLGVKGLNS